MGETIRNDTQEGRLANEFLATIRVFDWNKNGVSAWIAIVALSMVLRYITEYCDPEEDMRE